MIAKKRWYVKHDTTIDLKEVSSVITVRSGKHSHEYLISFKNGDTVPFSGSELNTQFREYHGIEVDSE